MTGVVQGVGFRPFVHRVATELGLAGFVGNDSGAVFVEVQGPSARHRRIRAPAARRGAAAGGDHAVRVVDVSADQPAGSGFRIVGSHTADGPTTPIPPDVAVCDDCVAELFDPADRRYRHPFVTCTNCGPRFTIIRALPYDRPATTMSAFTMCERCAAEYHDPADRRFHAQPIAAPTAGRRCGSPPRPAGVERARCRDSRPPSGRWPRARWSPSRGSAAITWPARRRRGGGRRAARTKGSRRQAVRHAGPRPGRRTPLRPDRRRRGRGAVEAGPADRVAAAASGRVGRRRRRARQPAGRADAAVLPDPSPAAGPVPGVPSTGTRRPGAHQRQPLRRTHLLHRRRCVATTSALCDAVLDHDRPIHVPCDDSVVRVVDGQELPIRRSRGYAPLPVALGRDGPPVLAVGGELKNTFCLTDGARAYLSGHIGDMATWRRCRRSSARWTSSAKSGISPQRLAADLHPGYHTRSWAERRAGDRPARSRSAPPRARGVAAGRTRAHRRADHRGRVRRHRLRLRPHDLGRRDPPARAPTATASPGPATCCRYRCRVVMRRCAIRAGRRWPTCGWPTSTGRRICRRSPRPRRRTAAHPFTIGQRRRDACRARAWAGCSTRSHRCWACGTGSTTKARPPSSSRRWPSRLATPRGPRAATGGTRDGVIDPGPLVRDYGVGPPRRCRTRRCWPPRSTGRSRTPSPRR